MIAKSMGDTLHTNIECLLSRDFRIVLLLICLPVKLAKPSVGFLKAAFPYHNVQHECMFRVRVLWESLLYSRF